ncbi:hypothetical protein LXA43DRAFT_1095092 [Ganoderma leucocontextum]|nr:hypothetical protein LXA43DRAFT_1095092 [Ganoderma leucocontextum]
MSTTDFRIVLQITQNQQTGHAFRAVDAFGDCVLSRTSLRLGPCVAHPPRKEWCSPNARTVWSTPSAAFVLVLQRGRKPTAHVPRYFDSDLPLYALPTHTKRIVMDAFFTIAPPVPVDEPVADVVFINYDDGTSDNHSGCTIA